MNYLKKLIGLASLILVLLAGCSSTGSRGDFPDFITENDDYYITRIAGVPEIDESEYRLKIYGLVDKPVELSLQELLNLEMVELPLTVECIGNETEGELVSTAVWKGFNLYKLLMSLGLSDSATGVKYIAADGYFASHTMDQLKDNGIIGAVYMNGDILPPEQGFPLRILNPGYHGVKQPAWVTDIEVIDMPIKDYWDEFGWDCSPPMAVDTKIFFPANHPYLKPGDELVMGGAAFGGTRVVKVEYSINGSRNWKDADIVQRMDADNVWVFWQASIILDEPGDYSIKVRATDIHGNVQQEKDDNLLDGNTNQPELIVHVKE